MKTASITQIAMISAAASIAALMPTRPTNTLLANREEKLVYSVFEAAAKAAYLRAAHACFNAARDAVEVEIDSSLDFDWICRVASLRDLIGMCETGHHWGGGIFTL
jgi:hypothetical protein